MCHVPLLSVRQISFLICELEVYIEFYYHPLVQLLQMQSYQAISQQIMLLYVSIVKTLFSHIYYIHSFKYYMLGYLPSCYNFSCPFMVMQGYISRRKLHCISNKLCQLVQIQNGVKPLTFKCESHYMYLYITFTFIWKKSCVTKLLKILQTYFLESFNFISSSFLSRSYNKKVTGI